MTRLAIKTDTIKALFAKSGNLCAFPGCTHELITDKNLFVGQLIHIEAVSPEGPRYNSNSSGEERRNFKNLILLCYRHHKEIDSDPDSYTEAILREMKAVHESTFGKKLFKIDESVIFQIEKEMEVYWREIEKAKREKHPCLDLAIPINTNTSPIELFNDLRDSLKQLGELTDLLYASDNRLDEDVRELIAKLGYNLEKYESNEYYQNPFLNRNWETYNLGITNRFKELDIFLTLLEIRYLELFLKFNPQDEMARLRFEKAKSQLAIAAEAAGYVD